MPLSTTATRSVGPQFWSRPFRYIRWASHERPAWLWSVVIGGSAPLLLIIGPPIKKYYGWEPRPEIPTTYPIPKGPRNIPEGYDD